MKLDEWLDTQALKALSQHASAIVAAILVFALVASLLRMVLPPGIVTILEWVENIVLVGLFLWFTRQMALVLWKGRMRNGPANCVMVA